MPKKRTALARWIIRALGHPRFWWVIMGIFLLESLWFVISAKYPMAFDENYHFGLIQLHAQQWLPFFTHQPPGAGVYGAVVRDPSYLYHWLMSFPYRFICLFTHDQTAQVIFLRLINVGLFAGALMLYRKIVRRMGASRALTNSLFLVFVMIPVVPFLAATINYDNLLIGAIGLTVILALNLMEGFERGRIDAAEIFWLVIVLLLSSLVKYPFLPVFAVTGLAVVWRMWRSRLLGHAGWRSFAGSFASLRLYKRIALVLVALLSLGLFAERYGRNAIVYHNLVPVCDVVISQDQCIQYGPYARDHALAAQKPSNFHAHIFSYATQWLWGMWYRLFFAISDTYATAPPLLFLAYFAVGCAVLLGVGVLLRFRHLFADHPERRYLLWLVIGYAVALFIDGLHAYAKTGQPVAINGRYLIPFLPFIFVLGGLAWAQLLHRRPEWKAAMAGLIIAIFLLQGGGTMTFIVRSSDDWMWPNATIRMMNREVRDLAWPLILGKGNY